MLQYMQCEIAWDKILSYSISVDNMLGARVVCLLVPWPRLQSQDFLWNIKIYHRCGTFLIYISTGSHATPTGQRVIIRMITFQEKRKVVSQLHQNNDSEECARAQYLYYTINLYILAIVIGLVSTIKCPLVSACKLFT